MTYEKTYRVPSDKKITLASFDPDDRGGMKKKEGKKRIDDNIKTIVELQYKLYAEAKQSLLIVLQALDAGGKDGTVKHVFRAMNPQGCTVTGFKQPSAEEKAHDFLWRIHPHAPEKGSVAIFNRSHYEDVLVVRVHDLAPEKIWSQRYALINDFERQLVQNGTRILKFYLHISKDEQLQRFKRRLDDPARHWKISESDYTEREYWDDYVAAYEAVLNTCSPSHAPWYVIPANHKWYRNLVISEIVRHTMEEMKMSCPAPTIDIDEIRRKYHAAEKEEKREENIT